jgi:hypothetical protein
MSGVETVKRMIVTLQNFSENDESVSSQDASSKDPFPEPTIRPAGHEESSTTEGNGDIEEGIVNTIISDWRMTVA